MEAFNKVKPKKIKLSDYEMDRTLGSGSFGRVKLAKNKKDGTYVAIKILKKSELIKLKQVDLSKRNQNFIYDRSSFFSSYRWIYSR